MVSVGRSSDFESGGKSRPGVFVFTDGLTLSFIRSMISKNSGKQLSDFIIVFISNKTQLLHITWTLILKVIVELNSLHTSLLCVIVSLVSVSHSFVPSFLGGSRIFFLTVRFGYQ